MTKLESSVKIQHSFLWVLLATDFIWARSSFQKIINGGFIDSLAVSLAKFASNNPYPWYKNFLEKTVIPNYRLFGELTLWGEALTAISIFLPVVYLLFNNSSKNKLILLVLCAGLIGGMFLNIIFWLAAGWTSPSTESINLLMFLIQFIMMFYIIKDARW